MNLVCDESVERQVVDRLRMLGHSVLYVAELDPAIDDDVVLAHANDANAPLATSHKDFGDLVYRQGLANHGVILMRLSGLTNERKAEVLAEVVSTHGDELLGVFSVVSPGRVRIRKNV